jgi:hypothetical protein
VDITTYLSWAEILLVLLEFPILRVTEPWSAADGDLCLDYPHPRAGGSMMRMRAGSGDPCASCLGLIDKRCLALVNFFNTEVSYLEEECGRQNQALQDESPDTAVN